MIDINKKIKEKSLEAISRAKDCTYFRIMPTGKLLINNYFNGHVFLAYVNGNWFAAFGNRTSSSTTIPENGLDLFAYGDNSIWIRNSNNDIDISTPAIPLDKNTCAMLFTFYGKEFVVIIADGSKYDNVISTHLKKTPENTVFLIMTLTSMIRQYDDKTADDILKFWFSKNTSDESKKEYPCQIRFEKNEKTEEA